MSGATRAVCLIVVVASGVALCGSYTHHLVKTSTGVLVVPRTVSSFRDAYVDGTVPLEQILRTLHPETVKAIQIAEKREREKRSPIQEKIDEVSRRLPPPSPGPSASAADGGAGGKAEQRGSR